MKREGNRCAARDWQRNRPGNGSGFNFGGVTKRSRGGEGEKGGCGVDKALEFWWREDSEWIPNDRDSKHLYYVLAFGKRRKVWEYGRILLPLDPGLKRGEQREKKVFGFCFF